MFFEELLEHVFEVGGHDLIFHDFEVELADFLGFFVHQFFILGVLVFEFGHFLFQTFNYLLLVLEDRGCGNLECGIIFCFLKMMEILTFLLPFHQPNLVS